MKYILTMIMVALLASTAIADTSVDLDGNGHIDEAFGGTNRGSIYSPTVQADDPTVSSDNGIYFATTSQKMFIKDDEFLWASSVGTYTLIGGAVAPEYTLNLNISGQSGADAINGFTTSQVITGLTADYTLTGVLGDSTALACTGVTGSGLSYLAGTASADVTADCVFSAESTPTITSSIYWSADDATALDTPVSNGLTANGGATVGIYQGRQAADVGSANGGRFEVTSPSTLITSIDTLKVQFDVYIATGDAGGDILYFTGQTNSYNVRVESNGKVCGYFGSGVLKCSTSTVAFDAWNTIVVDKSATDVGFTINEGTTETVAGVGTLSGEVTTMVIGGSSAAWAGFDGVFDEVYIDVQ